MPAGPGKFEGEGFATWALYHLSLVSAQDDQVGTTDTIGWWALFKGPIARDEIEQDVRDEGEVYGWSLEEIDEGLAWLEQMAGAILNEGSQGFVSATLYSSGDLTNGRPGLDVDWKELQDMDAEIEDVDA